ncbi:MAG: hypothetical protein II007_04600 [Gammaproteobacteria bacterium]|nr:hypothetical protein [Gammaproteobacteria bacterium]
MARKPATPMTDLSVPADEARIDALYAAEQEATAPASQDDRDLVNQLLGQAQALSATSSMLQTFGVSKLAFVKENKLYRALAGRFGPNGLELKGTWQEFCGLLGMSDEKANQDIANLRTFGEAALESMSRMGIGYRELRQFRKLPDASREALIEAAKTGDKERLIDIAEELSAEQDSAKAALEKQLAETRADLEVNRELVVRRERDLKTRDEELIRLRKSLERATPDSEAEHWRQEIGKIAIDIECQIAAALRTGFESLMALADQGIDSSEFMAGVVCQIERTLWVMRDDLGIKHIADGNPIPLYAREVVEAE